MSLEFNQRLSKIELYPAAEGYALSSDVAALASNESPFPPLVAVQSTVAQALKVSNRYPDPTNTKLRAALSDRYGVPANHIAVGNGASDILLAASEVSLEPGAEFVYAWPSFSLYRQMAQATGANAIEVRLDRNQRHDLKGLLGEITVATRLVAVCNPNNPTSTAVKFSALREFVSHVPSHVCVIIDEAYCEYSLLADPDESLDLIKRYSNVVLLRTFSKIYSLCGLRVGYALCGSEQFPLAVNRIRQPFSVNVAAQAAAVEALKHTDEVTRRVEYNLAQRTALAEAIRGLGLELADSEANFLWFAVGEDRDERAIIDGLRAAGVLVRGGKSLGQEGWVRVTVGKADENERFIAVLESVL